MRSFGISLRANGVTPYHRQKKYADVQTEIEEAFAQLEPLSDMLTEAVNLDSEAYDQVFRAYKMPKETDEQKQERNTAIETAMRHAAEVPLSVCRACKGMFAPLKTLAQKGNQNAITDVYVATLCARTAILGASANVAINLPGINDPDYIASTKAELDELRKYADRAEDEMTAIMINKNLA